MLIYTRMFSLYFTLMLTLCQKSSCSDSLVYQFEITEYDTLSTSFATDIYAQSQRVRRDVDSTCESQEQTFLSDIIGDKKKRIEEKVIPQIKLQIHQTLTNGKGRVFNHRTQTFIY